MTVMSEDLIKFLQDQINVRGKEGTLEVLSALSGYERIPPSIDEFVDSKEYLGDFLGSQLFPAWRRALKEIYPNPFTSAYIEVCPTGSIGTGKSTFSLAGLMYDCCRTLCLKNPHDRYDIVKSDKITFALINATQTLAKGVLYDQMYSWVNNSPFFKSMLNTSKSSKTLFKKNVHIHSGSRSSDFLGQAVVGAILSELNFQNKAANQAYENYTNARIRMKSRFDMSFRKHGIYPGRLYLDSSKNADISFLEEHIQKAKEESEDNYGELVKVLDYAYWEVHSERKLKDGTKFYSGKTFKVFVGDKVVDPYIVEGGKTAPKNASESLIMDVPVEHKEDFLKDIHRALRDLAGMVTWSSHSLFSSIERLNKSFSRVNPVSKHSDTGEDEIELDFFDQDQRLIHYIRHEDVLADTRPRFIHIDIGLKKDRLGIACTRINGWRNVNNFDPKTGKVLQERQPLFWTDWIMCIAPKTGQDVPLYKIKNFINDLRSRGYPIVKVTTDGYQSENLRQDLKLMGFNTELLSVDRKTDQYYYFKDSVLEDRYNGVGHPKLRDELEHLQDLGDKVDHPLNGCFTGETEVDTVSHGDIAFKEISKRIHSGEEFLVPAIDRETGEQVVGSVIGCEITKFVDEVVDVELDDGSISTCTVDHFWMLSDLSYRQAESLKECDRLKTKSSVKTDKKIKSVTKRKLRLPIPVYDLEVKEYGNFALSVGVFVHNSKDIADAVCGSVWAARHGMEEFGANVSTQDYLKAFKEAQKPLNDYENVCALRGLSNKNNRGFIFHGLDF